MILSDQLVEMIIEKSSVSQIKLDVYHILFHVPYFWKHEKLLFSNPLKVGEGIC